MKENSLQLVQTEEVKEDYPIIGMKPKRINKVKDARRLLAYLIYRYQVGDVSSDYIKTMCYALIKYSELYKVESLENIEKRIEELERGKK